MKYIFRNNNLISNLVQKKKKKKSPLIGGKGQEGKLGSLSI
jgi:hypothetical protein